MKYLSIKEIRELTESRIPEWHQETFVESFGENQFLITCKACGATWVVVECVDTIGREYLDVEEISAGEEDFCISNYNPEETV